MGQHHGGGSEGRCRGTGIWQRFVINSGDLKNKICSGKNTMVFLYIGPTLCTSLIIFDHRKHILELPNLGGFDICSRRFHTFSTISERSKTAWKFNQCRRHPRRNPSEAGHPQPSQASFRVGTCSCVVRTSIADRTGRA